MSRLTQLANNAKSLVATQGCLSGTGTGTFGVTSGTGNLFPATTGSQSFAARLSDPTNNVYGNFEILTCTRAAGSDTITVTARGAEGSTAQIFPVGATVQLTWTAAALMAYLRPGRGLVKLPVPAQVTAGQLLNVDTDGNARGILSQLGAAVNFNAADSPAVACVNLDANRVLIVYANGTTDCRAIVATVYGGVLAFGASVQINNASAGVAGGVAVCAMSSALALVAFANAATSVKAVTLSIAGTVITVNSAGIATVEAAAGTALNLAAISPTVGVLVYNSGAANGKACAIQLTGGPPTTTCNPGALQTFNAASTIDTSVYGIDQGRAIVAYSSAAVNASLKVLTYTAPNTLAVGAATQIVAQLSAAVAVCMLNPINGMVAVGETGAATLYLAGFSVQGTTVTIGGNASLTVGAIFASVEQIAMRPVDAGSVLIAYANSTTNGRAVVAFAGGGAVWFGTDTLVKTNNLSSVALCMLSPGVAVMAFRDATAALGQALAVPCGELAYQAKALALETEIGGASCWCALRGYPHETTLALTPGEYYFAQMSGLIDKTARFFPNEPGLPATNNPLVQSRRPVGRAMSSSLLLLYSAER